jgi:hypothetical protein
MGAAIDLTQYWFAEEKSEITAYVLDSHRPIMHTNINSKK